MVASPSFALGFARALLTGDMNVIGLMTGFAGGVLVTLYGMPSLRALSSASYSELVPSPITKRYNRISKVGLMLLTAGFAFQLIPAVSPMPVRALTASLIDLWTAALAFVSAVF